MKLRLLLTLAATLLFVPAAHAQHHDPPVLLAGGGYDKALKAQALAEAWLPGHYLGDRGGIGTRLFTVAAMAVSQRRAVTVSGGLLRLTGEGVDLSWGVDARAIVQVGPTRGVGAEGGLYLLGMRLGVGYLHRSVKSGLTVGVTYRHSIRF